MKIRASIMKHKGSNHCFLVSRAEQGGAETSELRKFSDNIGAEGGEQVKNEAEQSGARRSDMSGAKRVVQR